MNANAIITDDMTLDEKLAAIDEAMAMVTNNIQREANQQIGQGFNIQVQPDPADLTMCLGCQ